MFYINGGKKHIKLKYKIKKSGFQNTNFYIVFYKSYVINVDYYINNYNITL